jgi:hypothetical protein
VGRRGFHCALLLAALLGGAPARGDEDLDELLGGFEDEAAEGEPDDLGGFDGDDRGGFDGEDEAEADRELPPPPLENPLRGESWQLTGSVGVASSINFIPHRSAWGPPPDQLRGTNYLGLSKLRTRLNLQLDADLPLGWEVRAQGFGYYDWTYLIRGRDKYTNEVLDLYEWDADTQDFWIWGSPFEDFDVKLGRQVVNWGRSESLRVLDVLNPLDNREPGISDIEDLRRAVTMGRFDYYLGDWNLSLIAIPEIRFGQNPPIGSDFNPVAPEFDGVPLPPRVLVIKDRKPDSLEHWEAAARLRGIFEGWDWSLNFAYYYDDFGVVKTSPEIPMPPEPPPTPENPIVIPLIHSRIWMVGSGVNYTLGSWLLKAELAYLDGLLFTDAGTRSRLDAMLGFEYYGFSDTTLSIEVVNRHVFDFPPVPTVGTAGIVPQEDDTQAAFRLTRSFLRERLDATIVALIFSGIDEVGSVVRVDASYDLRDALVLTAGVVLYQAGDLSPLSTYGPNDRFFWELKWSF